MKVIMTQTQLKYNKIKKVFSVKIDLIFKIII
jgi:hypothetical protein